VQFRSRVIYSYWKEILNGTRILVSLRRSLVVADLGVRSFSRKVREKHKRHEREEALAVSLKLDFTREAKSLSVPKWKNPFARILCVDDEEVILDSFRKILVLDGYSVDTVQTGRKRWA